MGGDSGGGYAWGSVDFGAKAEDFGAGVIVIAQKALAFFYLDLM
jgi:hypothetical protein